MTRVAALDHGAARCGVAVSDPTGTIVSPLAAVELPDSRQGLDRIERICLSMGVETLVVGLPLAMSGDETEQTGSARRFADRLRGRLRGVEVIHFDERLTTSEASRLGGDADEDSRAAAVLLERWLLSRSSA